MIRLSVASNLKKQKEFIIENLFANCQRTLKNVNF